MAAETTIRSRTWAFTIQAPTDMQYVILNNITDEAVKWLAVAQERGEEAKALHLQGAVSFKHAKTWSAAYKTLGLKGGDHLTEQRASEYTNAAYCLKGTQSKEEWESEGVDGDNYGAGLSETDFDGVTSFGFWTVGSIPKRSDGKKTSVWDDILQAVENGWTDLMIMQKWPEVAVRCSTAIGKYRLTYQRANAGWRDLEVIYLSGDTGVGKTRYVMEKYGYSNCFRVNHYGSGAFDSYDGQDVLILEEFRSSFKCEQMLNILDGYPLELPARYADKFANFTKVFIISNWNLYQQYEGIQSTYPKTWDAFLRRIHGIGMISGEGELKVMSTPSGQHLFQEEE